MIEDFDDNELEEIYQSVVLQHSKKPLNFGKIENIQPIKGKNPSCGDQIDLYILKKNDLIEDIKFQGEGCALCIASASLMTSILKGKPVSEGQKIFTQFSDLIQGKRKTMENSEYEKLEIFNHVHKFPARGKCAMLSWRALEKNISKG